MTDQALIRGGGGEAGGLAGDNGVLFHIKL